MTITQKFWNFIQPICANIEGVKYVEISDGERMDRFRSDSTSQDVYPGVFIIRPAYKGMDNFAGQQYASCNAIFYILVNAEMNSYAELDNYKVVNEAFDEAERISIELQRQLRHSLDIMFDFNTWKSEPVSAVTIDNAWGIEIKVTITIPISEIVC